MLACIFATNRNTTTSDRPSRWTIQSHLQEWQSNDNPNESKVETVSIDCVKPAHFERESESGTNTKLKTQPKTMSPKPAGIACGPRRNRLRHFHFKVGQDAGACAAFHQRGCQEVKF